MLSSLSLFGWNSSVIVNSVTGTLKQIVSVMQKIRIFSGLVVLPSGLVWPWMGKPPFGRLPGDILIDKPGFKFFMPITSMLLVSGLVSLILWLLRK